MDLDGAIDDALGGFGGKELGHGGFAGEPLRARVLRPGRAIDEQARRVELGRHVGERRLRELEAGERTAELPARLHMRARFVERARRQAAGGRADAGAEEIQRAEREPHAVPLFAEPLRRRHAAARKPQLGDRMRRRHLLPARDRRGRGWPASTTNALIARFGPSAVRAKTTKNDAIVAFEMKTLAAVEDVVVAVAHCAGRDRAGVGASVRLGQRERRDRCALPQRRRR